MGSPEVDRQAEYPEGLLRWAGHRDGGVRKSFVAGGRPADGRVFATSIGERLRQWAEGVVHGRQAPRAVLLVGGPGNGKTDAVEQFVAALGTIMACHDELLERCRLASLPDVSGRVPRAVRITFGDLLPESTPCRARELWLIQDGSVGSVDPLLGPEEGLVRELANVQHRNDLLYLCCVNRGVLADALTYAREVAHASSSSGTQLLLEAAASAVAQGGIPRSCWPLEHFPHVAAWPMDAESLLAEPESPARLIFESALEEGHWTACSSCAAAAACPFKQNRDALSSGDRLERLLEILRSYERASGKRWTFRELYSLVTELLVGHESDFRTKDATVAPCDWVRDQVALTRVNETPTPRQLRQSFMARLQLASRLYQHALFPEWPDLSSARADLRKASKDVVGPGREAALAVFGFLADRREREETQLRRLLQGSVTPQLDPALAEPELRITEKRSVQDLELAFSQGIREGLERCRATQDLSGLERDVLDVLERAEGAMGRGSVPRNKSNEARRVRQTLRSIGLRFVKRSILVRRGLTRDHQLLEAYRSAVNDDDALRKVQRGFSSLLNRQEGFRASLLRCIGQPQRSASRDVLLVSGKVRIRARSIAGLSAPGTAPTTTPFLEVEIGKTTHPVALTFNLFKALSRLSHQCHPACLPADVLALLQGVESRVAGERIRNRDLLQEEGVYLELLGGSLFIRVEAGDRFVVTVSEPT